MDPYYFCLCEIETLKMILEPCLCDVLFHFLLTDRNVTDEEKQDTSPTQVEGVKVSDASTQGHQDITFTAASPSDRPQPPTEPLVSAHTASLLPHPPAACAKIQSLLYQTRWVVLEAFGVCARACLDSEHHVLTLFVFPRIINMWSELKSWTRVGTWTKPS